MVPAPQNRLALFDLCCRALYNKDTMTKRCSQCDKLFDVRPKYPWQKFCSNSCRQAFNSIRFHLPSLGESLQLAASTVGALNELRVAVDLMARGFHVFRALSPACECDLIATSNGKVLRVEVKTGYRRKSGKVTGAPIRNSDSFDILALATVDEIIYQPALPEP